MKPITGKYDFLLALNVGESHAFENKPSLSEAKRKVAPSMRGAYIRITQGVIGLQKRYPDHRFSVGLSESKGSRLSGNLVKVTLVARGSDVSSIDDLNRLDAARERRIEVWKKRKQAEDAPKLPGQLEEAEKAEHGRRVAAAVRAQTIKAQAPIIDPVKLAELVVAHTQGKTIQKLNGDGWIDDPHPTWKESTALYRIKPVLREFYVVVGRDGKPSAAATSLLGLPTHDPTCRVHVREIPDDDE